MDDPITLQELFRVLRKRFTSVNMLEYLNREFFSFYGSSVVQNRRN